MMPAALVRRLSDFLKGFRSSQSGATAALVAVAFIPLFAGMMSLVFDLNNARQIQNRLQASADAAALAASMDIGSTTVDPLNTANTYGSASESKNAIAGISNFSLTMVRKCLTQTTFGTCLTTNNSVSGGLASINTILITESASVSTVFSKYFGISKINITVQSEAAGHGGGAQALDVAVILDTTASMNSTDTSCASALGVKSPSQLDCAKLGLRNLLIALNATNASVAVLTFPGYTDTNQAKLASTCPGGSKPSIAPYSNFNTTNQSWFYTVAGLSKSYQKTAATSSNPATLDSSNAVAAAAGATGCDGLQAVGGVQTYYSDAIAAAVTLLQTDTSNARKVIVLLSDGDANSSQVSASKSKNECAQAVTQANTARSAGIEVFAVGYGAQSSGCSTDGTVKDLVTGNTGPCGALAQIGAPAATYFYYDTPGSQCTGGNPIASGSGGIAAALAQIGTQLQAAVLIPISST